MIKLLIKKIKPRLRDTHKGTYGHVFVLAGSAGMTGAAYLTSTAALLSGSGLVTLGIPKGINPIMEEKLVEVMTKPLPETRAQTLSMKALPPIREFVKKADVIAIGPGLSGHKETKALVRRLVVMLDKNFVLDADGINAFKGAADLLKRVKTEFVITPHAGEMSRLTGMSIASIQKDRKGVAKKVSKLYNCITVLKGSSTVVANPKGEVYINETGNPGMATGGVGDILTGIIASLMGQGLEPFGAAKLGVYIHGRAGDLAMREKGEISLIATDILNKLPEVFKKL